MSQTKNPNACTFEPTHSLEETANLINKTQAEVELLIRQERMGFVIGEYALVVTQLQIASYLLGEKPRTMAGYQSERASRKKRRQYPKARSRR